VIVYFSAKTVNFLDLGGFEEKIWRNDDRHIMLYSMTQNNDSGGGIGYYSGGGLVYSISTMLRVYE